MYPCQISVQIIAYEIQSTKSTKNIQKDSLINDMNQKQIIQSKQSLFIGIQKIAKKVISNFPGRKQEVQKVKQYIKGLLMFSQGPLCISGTTGCGKTSLTNQFFVQTSDFNKFQVCYINCMQVISPHKIYSCMLQKLFDKKCRKPEAILQKLLLRQKDDILRIVILDEIDQFINKKSFVYNILQWCQASSQPFGLILISNMVDLTQKLTAKLKSRIKFNEIIFKPYSFMNLRQILLNKYSEQSQLFSEDAIMYLCKKIANQKSDVRILQRCFLQIINRLSPIQSYVSIQSIANILSQKSQQTYEILMPYKFILNVFINSPKQTDISQQLSNQCRIILGPQISHRQLIHMLVDLKDFRVIDIVEDKQSADLVFRKWGINLTGFFYLLSTNGNL